MRSDTVDFGIDLGTTNSAIARFTGGAIEVFKNNKRQETTPSAVLVNVTPPEGVKEGAIEIIVGSRAYEKWRFDPPNVAVRFKRELGSTAERLFESSGRRMSPEALSAEVLKSLLGDAARQGHRVTQAVITAPASFEQHQIEATGRAAKLAGLARVELIQEPVAAAMAYGYDEGARDGARWLVYDFGGGTFDAAVIGKRHGQLEVMSHLGDNDLGGSNIDIDIVDHLLVPKLPAWIRDGGIATGKGPWVAPKAKLLYAAENAKIALSQDESFEVEIETLCNDSQGRGVNFTTPLRREDIERIAEPYIARTVEICRRVLEQCRLRPADIDKVLLVGGPTMMPYLRKRLADDKHGLGIELDFTVDPMTVVARGAARCAAALRLAPQPQDSLASAASTSDFQVELEYSPTGPETTFYVMGKVSGVNAPDMSGYRVAFHNPDARIPKHFGPYPLDAQGRFECPIEADTGARSTFTIELLDPTGRPCSITPNFLSYMVADAVPRRLLMNDIGVALATGDMDVFFQQGTEIRGRLRQKNGLKTAYLTRANGGEIRIPVHEGNSPLAQRNRVVGSLIFPKPSDEPLVRDLPAGTEVTVTLEMDESQHLTVSAYISDIDREFEEAISVVYVPPSYGSMQPRLQQCKTRITALAKQANEVVDTQALDKLKSIHSAKHVPAIEHALEQELESVDAQKGCESRLLSLEKALDEVEAMLSWPVVEREASEQLVRLREDIVSNGTSDDKEALQQLEQQIEDAITTRDRNTLLQRQDHLGSLWVKVVQAKPGFWLGYFQFLEGEKDTAEDKELVAKLLALGHKAIQEGELDRLQAICRQLGAALRKRPGDAAAGSQGSTVVRK